MPLYRITHLRTGLAFNFRATDQQSAIKQFLKHQTQIDLVLGDDLTIQRTDTTSLANISSLRVRRNGNISKP